MYIKNIGAISFLLQQNIIPGFTYRPNSDWHTTFFILKSPHGVPRWIELQL